MEISKKEFIEQITFYDKSYLQDHIDELEAKGIHLILSNTTIFELSDHLTLSFDMHRIVVREGNLVDKFMVGKITHPKTFEEMNYTENAFFQLLDILFDEIIEKINPAIENDSNLKYFYCTCIQAQSFFNHDEGKFMLSCRMRYTLSDKYFPQYDAEKA